MSNADACFLSNNIMDYYFVSQGKTSIPGVDDGEESELTDVRNLPQRIQNLCEIFLLEVFESITVQPTLVTWSFDNFRMDWRFPPTFNFWTLQHLLSTFWFLQPYFLSCTTPPSPTFIYLFSSTVVFLKSPNTPKICQVNLSFPNAILYAYPHHEQPSSYW